MDDLSPIFSQVPLKKSPDQENFPFTYDAIASRLIHDNLLLTALELHTELVECGRELPRLKEYFSNPGNFEKQAVSIKQESCLVRSSSQATLDSLDFARYSEDGVVDEKVAVLEFELRKAKETINSLRAHLTLATESEVSTPDHTVERPLSDELIKPHEKRALNFLVNEYLMKQGYKLTSITFADENESQDFEDWDDVGLNIPKPPDVVCLFKEWLHHSFPSLLMEDVSCQTSEEDDVFLLKQQLNKMQDMIYQLQLELAAKASSIIYTENTIPHSNEISSNEIHEPTCNHINEPKRIIAENHFVEPESPVCNESRPIANDISVSSEMDEILYSDTKEENGSIFSKELESLLRTLQSNDERKFLSPDKLEFITLLSSSTQRKLPEIYQKALLMNCIHYQTSKDGKLALDLATLASSGDKVVSVLAVCLPHIVPNVILNKREELIPLIICTINLHPDVKSRDVLLNLLFNIIKRPDVDARQMILTGFLSIAQQLGPLCVESELLPQCWEQINHKYVERRLLVAEASGLLAPFVSAPIRNSLMISMLQQMLFEDKDESIRIAVVKSLTLLVAYMDDQDKFSLCVHLTLVALGDSSSVVCQTANKTLLPVLAGWALEMGNLLSSIVVQVLQAFNESAQNFDPLKATNNALSISEGNIIGWTKTMHTLLPFTLAAIVKKGKNKFSNNISEVPPVTTLDNLNSINTLWSNSMQRIEIYSSQFDNYIGQDWFETWEELDWIKNKWLVELINCLIHIPPNNNILIMTLVEFWKELCITFGYNLTVKQIRPIFRNYLWPTEDQNENEEYSVSPHLVKSTVPVYILAVLLVHVDEKSIIEVMGTVKKIFWTLSANRLSLQSISYCIEQMASKQQFQEPLLAMLWEGVVHTSITLRHGIVEMLGIVGCHITSTLLASKVIPALVTLANDAEISVRIATVSAFGTILKNCVQKEVEDKVYFQLQSFVDDPLYRDEHGMHLALIDTLGKLATGNKSHFRDEFIFPRLVAMAAHNNQNSSWTKRSDIALALVDVYAHVLSSPLTKQVIVECILPSLRCVHYDIEQVSPVHEETVLSMIRDLEARIDFPRSRSESINLVSSVTVGQGMEDMKNRVTKLFQTKPSAIISKSANIPSLPNLFKKK